VYLDEHFVYHDNMASAGYSFLYLGSTLQMF